jgi:hypothetical protein
MNKQKLLKEVRKAVDYNEPLFMKGDLEEMVYVYSPEVEQEIWDPFYDYTGLYPVDPLEEYSKETLLKFVKNFREQVEK